MYLGVSCVNIDLKIYFKVLNILFPFPREEILKMKNWYNESIIYNFQSSERFENYEEIHTCSILLSKMSNYIHTYLVYFIKVTGKPKQKIGFGRDCSIRTLAKSERIWNYWYYLYSNYWQKSLMSSVEMQQECKKKLYKYFYVKYKCEKPSFTKYIRESNK